MSLRLLHHARPPPLRDISGLSSFCLGVKPRLELIGPSRSYTRALHAGTHRASQALRSHSAFSRTSTSVIPPSIVSGSSRRLLSSRAYGSSLPKPVTSRVLGPWATLPSTEPSATLARLRSCSTHSASRSPATTISDMSPAEVDYRLPTNVKPTHYDVTVRTDISASQFDGVVTVQYVYRVFPTASCS